MKLITELNIKEIPSLITPFIAIAGYEYWKKRYDVFDKQLRSNKLLESYLIENHILEIQFFDIFQKHTKGLKPKITMKNEAQHELYSFMAISVQLFDKLSDIGKRRLTGSFRDSLQSDQGFLSLKHELMTLAHLNMRGFDVIANDIENGGGFDFLAHKGSLEIEVDAKLITSDSGKKIHNKDVYQFSEVLHGKYADEVKRIKGGYFISIEFENRMDKSPNALIELSENLINALNSETEIINENFSITIKKFDIDKSPFNSTSSSIDNQQILQEARIFTSSFSGKENEELVINWTPGVYAVIIMISSKQNNRVFESIYKQLKKSVQNQFSGRRPALIHALLANISAEELLAIHESDKKGGASAFRVISTRLFESEKRNHLHSVAYSSRGEFQKYSTDSRETHFNSQTPTYFFKNDANSSSDIDELDIFRTSDLTLA